MTAVDLLPCPFCGCTDIKIEEQDADTCWHECKWCQTSGPLEGKDEGGVEQGWNRRAPLSGVHAALAGMLDAFGGYCCPEVDAAIGVMQKAGLGAVMFRATPNREGRE